MTSRLLVFTTPVTGREDEYAAWQAQVHIPELLDKVSGLASAAMQRQVSGQPGVAPYLTVYELSGPAAEVMAEIEAVRPTLEVSDSLDVDEHRPRMMVYEDV